MYGYNETFNFNPISCDNPKKCSEFTRFQIADTILGKGNSTVIQVILPKDGGYNCSKIRINVYEYIDEADTNLIAEIKRYTSTNPLICNFRLSDAMS